MTPNFKVDLKFLKADDAETFISKVGNFLNAGGTPGALVNAYQPDYARDEVIRAKDVTGDDIPELLLVNTFASVAFICVDGSYQSLSLPVKLGDRFDKPSFNNIVDMTNNGINEIITVAFSGQIVSIMAWDGVQFQLLNGGKLPTYYEHFPCMNSYMQSSIETSDQDGDGLLELVLHQDIPHRNGYIAGLPWRTETRTCAWNGKAFSLSHVELAEPTYRFQAVQDADRAALAGDDEKASLLYEKVIQIDRLDWWSQARHDYEGNLPLPENFAATITYNPTPLPGMKPDPDEAPTLKAYAYFRLMVLHTTQGATAEAQIAYNTLQETFPKDTPGYDHAEMASAFWQEYETSKSIENACAKAVEYASQHPTEILSYLGNGEYAKTSYGYQSLTYTPQSICPSPIH